MPNKKLASKRNVAGIEIRMQGSQTWILNSRRKDHVDLKYKQLPRYTEMFRSMDWGYRKHGDFAILRTGRQFIARELCSSIFGKVNTHYRSMPHVAASYVGPKYRGRGYGTLLYLLAVEAAEKKNTWLMNDLYHCTSSSAARVWKSLERYVKSYKVIKKCSEFYGRTVYAAYGLNSEGREALARLRAAQPRPGRICRRGGSH